MVNTISGLKNINLLTKEQYDGISDLASDELYAVEAPTIVETYSDAAGNWYRIYSDGWCEQGGRVNSVAYNSATKNVTLLIPMRDNKYYASAIAITDASDDGTWNISTRVAGLTTTQMTVRGGANANGAYTGLCCWEVRGYKS